MKCAVRKALLTAKNATNGTKLPLVTPGWMRREEGSFDSEKRHKRPQAALGDARLDGAVAPSGVVALVRHRLGAGGGANEGATAAPMDMNIGQHHYSDRSIYLVHLTLVRS
jgi:hypothetical protein